MTAVIKVENLSKYYRLGSIGGKTLREDVQRWWAKVRKQPDPFVKIGENGEKGERGSIWALRNIDFEVQQGEIVGIIGGNGAGKSTLLKILSRIMAPTSGEAKIKGRVGSLLEVGTGFHPELTGRENIYLNGAILGMSRSEVTLKFDEIVDFAEIEQFIDTPVKRYSSGMYVRLAFAVAAHLNPEILLVDEVLAVGDINFQKKCIGKMGDVASEGRTVLFVSHNMAAVSALCSRGILLHQGKIKVNNDKEEAISSYLNSFDHKTIKAIVNRKDREGEGRLRFKDYWFEDIDGYQIQTVMLGKTVVVCLSYFAESALKDVFVAFDIRNHLGEAVTNCNTADIAADFEQVLPGEGVFRCTIRWFPIRSGVYTGNIYCSSRGIVCDFLKSAIKFNVIDGDFYGTGSLRNKCQVMLDHEWSVETDAGQYV